MFQLLVRNYPVELQTVELHPADFFHYLIIMDQYSNWPIVERVQEGSNRLIDVLYFGKLLHATCGIPDELSSDGGPEFVTAMTRSFLSDWGVHHRLSSVVFPHSNSRAVVGVRTVKHW